MDYKTTKMSPLAQAMGQRFHFKVLLHKPNTVNLLQSFNQAWLKMLYYKVITVNVVVHYKYIRHYAKKFQNFSITGSDQKKALVSFTDFNPARGI